MNIASAAIGFAVMAAYWPGLAGAALAPRWAAIAGVTVLVAVGPRITFTARHTLCLVFAGWFALTFLWSPYQLDGVDVLARFALLAGIFLWAAQLDEIHSVMAGAAAGLGVSSAIAIAQSFGFDWLPTNSDHPAGLFFNKNSIGEAAALVLVYALATRTWWAAIVVLPGFIIADCRAAFVAAGASIVVMLMRKSGFLAALVAIALVPIIAWAIFRHDFGSLQDRLSIWRDTAAHLTLFGHGVGSFTEMFPQIAHYTSLAEARPVHPHSEYLWVAFETGFVGLALMLVMFGALLLVPMTAERLVLIAILVESSLAFPFQNPATAFVGLLMAGRLAADCLHLRDAAPRGRVALRGGLEGAAGYGGGLS